MPSFLQDCFTRVLKGHIQLSMAVFPSGLLGTMLDTLARRSLWSSGLDYTHGTGHGVGSFLNVHEGPCAVSYRTRPGEAGLEAGMILSDGECEWRSVCKSNITNYSTEIYL